MKYSNLNRPMRLNKHHGGFSLVELMVAMILGLMIMGAVIAVLVTSKTTYTDTSGVSRLQENARFALTFLAEDLRRSGFYGCVYSPSAVVNQISVVANSGLNPPSALGIPGQAPLQVEAYENGAGNWSPTAGAAPAITDSDAIAIRYLDLNTSRPINNDPTSTTVSVTQSDPILVDTGHPFQIGDVVVIADCDSADVFQITGLTTTGTVDSLQHTTDTTNASPANSSSQLSKVYGTKARIMKLVTNVYSIQQGAGGERSLFRDANEVVEGIESLQILYGVATLDAQDNRIETIYLKADAMAGQDWRDIVSIRLGLLASDEATELDTYAHTVNGETIAAKNDHRQRRQFVATINLRNIRR